jgi:hypothetical protein
LWGILERDTPAWIWAFCFPKCLVSVFSMIPVKYHRKFCINKIMSILYLVTCLGGGMILLISLEWVLEWARFIT